MLSPNFKETPHFWFVLVNHACTLISHFKSTPVPTNRNLLCVPDGGTRTSIESSCKSKVGLIVEHYIIHCFVVKHVRCSIDSKLYE